MLKNHSKAVPTIKAEGSAVIDPALASYMRIEERELEAGGPSAFPARPLLRSGGARTLSPGAPSCAARANGNHPPTSP